VIRYTKCPQNAGIFFADEERRMDIRVEIYLNRIVIEYDGEQRTFTPKKLF
jgi:hypothetical protein